MHERARELIAQLALEPHPEGGLFRRTFQSRQPVATADGRGSRVALTAIYYLLADHGISRWHQVRSDEAWHWYEGAPIELFVAPAGGGDIRVHRLGPLAGDTSPQCVVPAGCWQAARCSGPYSLVGCCVAPGFDFADFRLLASLDERARPVILPASIAVQLL